MSQASLDPAPLAEDDLVRFEDFFYQRTGIAFGRAKRYFVERRLNERIGLSGEGNLRGYLARLRYDTGEDEIQALITAMTVNETYFFRETYQFDCLVRDMLPEISRRRPEKPLSIWSLPCSTGEEPYSIAIWLLEHWPDVDAHTISILGSDIDARALLAAQAGEYARRSLQLMPTALRERYFQPVGPDRWRVIAALRQSVEFSRVNIVDPAQMALQGSVDVIFCRNLLIYFDDASRRRAVQGLYEALAPGGFLCLGHSETMSRISELFIARKFADGVVYQKPWESAFQ